MSISGTLGAEEELQLFEPATGALAPNAPRLLRRLPSKSFSAELQRSTVEMNTATTSTLQELHNEIVHLRAELRAVAADFGLAVASVGMAPQATDDDFELTMQRPLQPHARGVPAAGRRAADLRVPGARRGQRPRPGGPGDRPSGGDPARPVGPVGQLPVLAGPRHRLRQHAHHDLATLAHLGRLRPPGDDGGVRAHDRRPGADRA